MQNCNPKIVTKQDSVKDVFFTEEEATFYFKCFTLEELEIALSILTLVSSSIEIKIKTIRLYYADNFASLCNQSATY